MVQHFYQHCLAGLPGLTPDWERIQEAYTGRAYHNLEHLAEMIGHYQALPTSLAPASAPLFGLALIYHDLIYVAGRKDNEARSADEACLALRRAGYPPADEAYCRRLIMATKTHHPTDKDEGLLVDLDLAVLARPTSGYNAYAKAVRQEFSRYPDFLYRPGRKKALRSLAERETLYYHPYFRDRWEETARKNVDAEISRY